VSGDGEPILRRTVGGGATIGTLAAAGTALAGGLLGIVVARNLGPDGTGAYNVATTTLLLAQSISTLGLGLGITYYASAGRWPPGDAFRQAQVGALVLGLASAAIGIGLAVLGRDSIFEGVPFGAMVIVFGALPLLQSWTFSAALAVALDRYETYALAPLSANVAALVLTLVLTPAFGVEGAVGALALAHLLTAARLVIEGRRTLPAPDPGWLSRTAGELRRAIRFGLPGHIPGVLQLITYRADLFVLNAVAASATVGHYAVALLVAELGLLLPRSLAAVVLPRVSALHDPSDAAGQDMVMTKAIRHTIVLAPLVAVGLAIAIFAIPLVFGSDFEESIVPGLILIPGVILAGLATVLAAVFTGRGFPHYALRTGLIVAPLTVAAFILVIPEYEADGAAVVSSISGLATALLNLHYFRRATSLRARDLVPRREDLTDYRDLAARGRDYARRIRRRGRG
jgi:O-antigen/teichoic acid export membrane protein